MQLEGTPAAHNLSLTPIRVLVVAAAVVVVAVVVTIGKDGKVFPVLN
jgi:hypothetical protein